MRILAFSRTIHKWDGLYKREHKFLYVVFDIFGICQYIRTTAVEINLTYESENYYKQLSQTTRRETLVFDM